jgi:hypothetical protein
LATITLAGSSFAINSASSSRFLSAFFNHLICILQPFTEDFPDGLIARKFIVISLLDCGFYFLNLPLIEFNKISNGRSGKKRFRTAGGFREVIQTAFKLRFQPVAIGTIVEVTKQLKLLM